MTTMTHRVAVSGCVVLALTCAPAVHAQAPADYKAMSINLEDVPYPHPVSFLPLTLYGESVRMAYMDVAPTATANGRNVVLLHGMNFFGEYWAGTVEALRAAGYRVIVPDQIGFGRSSKPDIPYTLHDMAANTRQLLRHLGIERAAVVGHSMGGMVASRFAFSYPDVTTHLALVNMIGLTDARRSRPWRPTDDVMRASLARDYNEVQNNIRRYFVTWKPDYEKYVRIHYGWTLSGDWPRLAKIRAHLQQIVYADPVVYDWPHIKAKTLVIGGERDGANFPELARNVANTIPGAELVLFESVGHNPHLEAPDRFHPALLQFLALAAAPAGTRAP